MAYIAGEKLLTYLDELHKDLKIFKLKDMAQTSMVSGSPNNNPIVPKSEETEKIYLKAW